MTLNGNYQFIGRSNAVFNYGGSYYYYLLLYAKTEPDTATGKHKVSLKMRVACQAGDGFYGYSTTGFAKVAGTTAFTWSAQYVPNGAWTTGSLTEGGVTYSRWADLQEGSAQVAVGYDSAKTVTLEASFQRNDMVNPPSWVPNTTAMTLSAQVTLPAIAGASVPTVSLSSVAMGGKVTINTNRKSTAFLHGLIITFNGQQVASIPNVADSYVWTVPDLVSLIPNATSGTCTITCKTFNGTAQVGSASCQLTLRVPDKSVPTVSLSSVAMGSSVTINTNRKSTAFLHGLIITFNGQQVASIPNVADSYVWTVPDLVSLIPNATSGICTITCKTFNGTAQVGLSEVSVTLTVPKASVPTLSAAQLTMGSELTIYTNRRSGAFTHKLTYTFGSATGTVATQVGDSCTWVPPLALMEQLTNATSGTGKLSCTTYNGTKQVGTVQEVAVTLVIPDEACSLPSLSASSVALGSALTLRTNRRSGAFTHKLTYTFGSASGPIATDVGASCTWTPPLELAEQIPNATSAAATVTCLTYNGTKQVGSAQSVQLSLRVPETAATKPDLTVRLSLDSPLTGVFAGLYIQNLTKLKVQTDAAGKLGATVKSTAITVGGRPYIAGSVLTAAGQVAVVAKVTDSRGFTNSVSQSITVLPYSKPAMVPAAGYSDIICARCDDSGNFTDSGTHLRIIARRSYSTLTANGVQKNFCAIRYRINGGSWVTILEKNAADTVDTGALVGKVPSLTSTYTVEVGVVDDMGNTASVTKVVPTDQVDIHLRRGGKGIALGGYSMQPGFTCYMDAAFFGQVGGVIADYVVEQGVTGVWHWRKWNSGTLELWGRVWQPVTDTVANASKYYSPEFTQALPFTLVEDAYVQASSTDYWADVGHVRVAGSTLFYKIISPGKWTDVSYNVGCSFHIMGRWK